MTKLALSTIPPADFFTGIGFTADEAVALSYDSCIHYKNEPASKNNKVWALLNETASGHEYSRNGFFDILLSVPSELKALPDYTDACLQLVEWSDVAIYPLYETINKIMTARCPEFRMITNHSIEMFLYEYLAIIEGSLNSVTFTYDDVVIENPFLSLNTIDSVDPITYYGLENYLAWLLALVEMIKTNPSIAEVCALFVDIELYTFPAGEVDENTPISDSVASGLCVKSTHSINNLDFKTQSEEAGGAEVFTIIDGLFFGIDFLVSNNIRPIQLANYSSEDLSVIESQESFSLRCNETATVESEIVFLDSDHNARSIVKGLNDKSLFLDIEDGSVRTSNNETVIAKITEFSRDFSNHFSSFLEHDFCDQ